MSVTSEVLLAEDANLQYRGKDLEEVFGDLGDYVKHHVTYQRPRLDILDNYYKGYNVGIHNRKGRTNKNRADNRIANPFAKYISQFVQGYITGIPVKVGADDEKLKELVSSVVEENDVSQLNSEIVLDLSKYGRAYELVYYRDGRGDKTVQLDVMNTFLIYDTTVTSEELCGVHYRLTEDSGKLGSLSNEIGVEVTIYTNDYVYVLQETSLRDFEVIIDEERSKPHSYKEVPVIEYKVDRSRQGDYEQVIGLIDSYDNTESDISNYMTDMNEALLVLSGDLRNLDWKAIDEGLRDGTILELDGGTDANGNRLPISAEYLYKQYDVNGTDSYMDRLKSDIHKFSQIPDMSDESFGNNVSGIAMHYKLIGLEQLAGKKIRAMERGFNKRYRLIVTSKEFTNEVNGIKDIKLTYKWSANIPENIEDEMRAFHDLGGELSQETLLSTLSFISSAEDEKKRVLSEKLGVTVGEINKLSPEQLRSVMGIVNNQTTVSAQGTTEEGVQVKVQTEEGINTQNREGVNKLNRLLDGEEVLV